MPRRKVAPRIQLPGVTANLATPGVSVPNPEHLPVAPVATSKAIEAEYLAAATGRDVAMAETAAAEMQQLIGILEGAADFYVAYKESRERQSVLQRGRGRQYGEQLKGYYEEVFGLGPTDDTAGLFPSADITIGDEDALRQWATLVASSHTSGMEDDMAAAFAGEVVPKLMKLGAEYVAERTVARDEMRQNLIVSDLASPNRPIMDVLAEGLTELEVLLAPGEQVSNLIFPAARTAFARGEFGRSSDLLRFTLVGDPEKRAKASNDLRDAMLPQLQTYTAGALSKLSPGDKSSLGPIRQIYEASGGANNADAIKQVANGARSFIRTPSGNVIEENVGQLYTLQQELAEQNDPLYSTLAGIIRDARVDLMTQEQQAVNRRNQHDDDELVAVTEHSLQVIHGSAGETQEEYFQYLRTAYPARSEEYIHNYHKLSAESQRATAAANDQETVISLESLAQTAWNPILAGHVRVSAAMALRDGKIDETTYRSVTREVANTTFRKLALDHPSYRDFKSSVEQQFFVAAGIQLSKTTEGLIDFSALEGKDPKQVAMAIHRLDMLVSDFERQWVEWHKDPQVQQLLTSSDRYEYDTAARAALRDIFERISIEARESGSALKGGN